MRRWLRRLFGRAGGARSTASAASSAERLETARRRLKETIPPAPAIEPEEPAA